MLLFVMFFLHIVDDFYLQKGLLANMKQKDWWRSQKEYKDLYKYDYIWALLLHAFSWSFMVMLPIAIMLNFKVNFLFSSVFVANWIIHAIVDDLKANKKKINLITDQSIHFCQIYITYLIYV